MLQFGLVEFEAYLGGVAVHENMATREPVFTTKEGEYYLCIAFHTHFSFQSH